MQITKRSLKSNPFHILPREMGQEKLQKGCANHYGSND